MLHKINVYGVVMASGDDILCFTEKIVNSNDLVYIGYKSSGLGLG